MDKESRCYACKGYCGGCTACLEPGSQEAGAEFIEAYMRDLPQRIQRHMAIWAHLPKGYALLYMAITDPDAALCITKHLGRSL